MLLPDDSLEPKRRISKDEDDIIIWVNHFAFKVILKSLAKKRSNFLKSAQTQRKVVSFTGTKLQLSLTKIVAIREQEQAASI